MNLKIPLFKWSARLHSDGFGVLIFRLLSFWNLKRRICKIQCKPINLMKIQKSAKHALPPENESKEKKKKKKKKDHYIL